MTQEDFLAAVTDQLRRRGAGFRPEEVKTFTAGAWMQGEPSPDPDMWAERFLADPARWGPVRKQDGWFGRAAGGGIVAGAVVGAVTTTAILAVLLLVTTVQGNPDASIGIVVLLSFMWLPGGVLGGLVGALLRKKDGWFGRAAGGGIAGAVVGAITTTACLAMLILVMVQFSPNDGMAIVVLSFMWLPGGVLGGLLGALLQARRLRWGWLLGGCLGGLLAPIVVWIFPFIYFTFNLGQYL